MVPHGYPAIVFVESRDSRVVPSCCKTMHVESRENEVLLQEQLLKLRIKKIIAHEIILN